MRAAPAAQHSHSPTTYQVVRAALPPGSFGGLSDGIIVVAASSDPEADVAAAREILAALGLLECSCCGLACDTSGG